MASTGEALEAVFARWARRTRAPGVAWGLVRGDELVAGGGIGTLRIDRDAVPDVDSVFRIASMTKSFTGAALMTLVVDGRLRLDDPVAMHVPELERWRGPTTDGPPLTVRHLVSMEAGLPTDDAWADRHVDLTGEQFDALIAAGAMFAWPPGVRFEYSNLGWGLIGQVIERVAGVRAQDLVTSSLIEPLDMTATTWVRPGRGEVAEPYRLQDRDLVHEGEPLGDGTIAPMGGIWTTVRDLARWVGFFTDAFPPRDGAEDGPLPRWARREMQQLRRVDELARLRPSPSGPSRMAVTGYGVGLSVRIDERLGVSVGHSGGLPGYGSHMRWLPEHGVGVIGLSNVTYGNMHAACIEGLEVLADLDDLGPAHRIYASLSLSDAGTKAAALLSTWNDSDADALLADNARLDEPNARRAAQAAELVSRYGRLEVASLEGETPLRGSFTAAGGCVRVEIGLNHEGRVQWLDVEDRVAPSDVPIVVDEEKLRAASGTAYVVVRPVAALADAFTRWQGEALDRLGGAPSTSPAGHVTLDRLGGAPSTSPAGHVTLKAFGSLAAPLDRDDEALIAAAVADWAGTQAPIELRGAKLGVFESERIPVLELTATESFRSALRAVRSHAERAGLPAGASDDIAVDDWVPHLSLVYPRDVDPVRWTELATWMSGVQTGDVACLAHTAELVSYDGGPERCLGMFRLIGGSG